MDRHIECEICKHIDVGHGLRVSDTMAPFPNEIPWHACPVFMPGVHIRLGLYGLSLQAVLDRFWDDTRVISKMIFDDATDYEVPKACQRVIIRGNNKDGLRLLREMLAENSPFSDLLHKLPLDADEDWDVPIYIVRWSQHATIHPVFEDARSLEVLHNLLYDLRSKTSPVSVVIDFKRIRGYFNEPTIPSTRHTNQSINPWHRTSWSPAVKNCESPLPHRQRSSSQS